MRKCLDCGRCGTPVKLIDDEVRCTTCQVSNPLDMARAQIAEQAMIHGETVDEGSIKSDSFGFLTFTVKGRSATLKPRKAARAKSA